MKDITVFQNEEFGSIRTLQIDNETWFVGKDVAVVLGYQNGSRDIKRHVEDEDMLIRNLEYQNGILDNKTILVNESGLYSLILRSNKPEAKQFKRWVTHEVLPAIRKTGSYAVTELDREQAEDEIPTTKGNSILLDGVRLMEIMSSMPVESLPHIIQTLKLLIATPYDNVLNVDDVTQDSVKRKCIPTKTQFNYFSFSQHLRTNNVKVSELAKQIEYKDLTVSRWMKGKQKPNMDARVKLYDVLGLPQGCFDNEPRRRRNTRLA